MIDLEDLLLDAAAVARITRLINEDRVPFGPIRDRILERAAENSGGLGSDSRLAELVVCPWCVSIWVAAGVVLVAHRVPGWPLLRRVLAYSLAAGWIGERSSSG